MSCRGRKRRSDFFMEFVGDFHLHGKYSRAVSKSMTFSFMAQAARQLGVGYLRVCVVR